MFELLDLVRLFVDYIGGLIGAVQIIEFNVGSVQVSFYDLIIGFIAMVFIISVFWKGAKT